MIDLRLRLRSRPGNLLIPLSIGVVVLLATFNLRLINEIKWNSWVLQFTWNVLRSSHSYGLPSSFPEGHDRAKVWLAQAALASGDTQRALGLIDTAALLKDPFALRIHASVMEKQGKFNLAIQMLVLAHDYNSLMKLSDNATRANNQPEALDALKAGLMVDPVQGVLPLVDYLTNIKGSLVEAERILKNALADHPKSPLNFSWHLSLGDNLRKQKLYDEAEVVYQSALIENPNYSLTYIGLGWVYYERGDGLQKAIKEFQNAIAIDKAAGDGYYSMAQILTREHRYSEAEPWYRLAIEHDQTHAGWYVTRAYNAQSMNRLDLALSIYQEAARLFPAYPAIYYEMAWAYQLNKQPEEAKKSIEKALVLKNPPNELYYLRAGQIYEGKGDYDLALLAFQEALNINPANSYAQQSVKRLGKP